MLAEVKVAPIDAAHTRVAATPRGEQASAVYAFHAGSDSEEEDIGAGMRAPQRTPRGTQVVPVDQLPSTALDETGRGFAGVSAPVPRRFSSSQSMGTLPSGQPPRGWSGASSSVALPPPPAQRMQNAGTKLMAANAFAMNVSRQLRTVPSAPEILPGSQAQPRPAAGSDESDEEE